MDTVVETASQKMSGIHLKDEEEEDSGPTEEEREKFNHLVAKAKKYVGEGRIEDALKLNKKALSIVYHEKLAKKIKKMEEYLKMNADDSDEEDDDDNGMMHLGKGLYLYKDLYKSLYAHQQEGVLWFWSLFRRKKGGILGDDMGLGKTIQVIAFLSGMFDMQKIRSVLIVLPVALMVNWEKEIEKWAPGLKVVAYHGTSKREKERALARVQRRGGICLTTYGLVVTSFEQLGTQDGREFVWDYLILDEGHKIKNPTKTSKGVHAIPANHRIILTGTPVQNNLKELWALFDFVHQGSLLGTQRTFKMEYDNPITRAREKDATVGEKQLGMEMAKSLKKIIAPYFLRRTKAEVKEREKNKENENPNPENHAVMPTMTRKNDLIVWTFLTETQIKIYQDFLSLDSVKELLMTTKSPLVALNVLKKICDHPRLLSTRACVQLGIDGDEGLDDDILETEAGNLSAVTRIQHVNDSVLIKEGGKLLFLVSLLDSLKQEGHRCLVFSQSRKMLDIMEKVITNRGHKIMRLDGTVAQVQEREQRIRKFQTDNSYSVFLLTTQVGGVGLTLTAANRVVIYDPSWNPATDAQAVDRVFRIGQDKNVVIYRLITCGTVEEKIYRRQVFKDSITKQTTGDWKNPYRYFSKYELRELFTMDDPHTSTTQQQLEQMHGGQRRTDTRLDEHIAFLYSLEMFGISDHDLMFSQGDGGGDDQDDGEGQCPESDYIQHRVQKAKELIQMESSQPISMDERHGKGQPSVGGGHGGAAMPRNWDIPKPDPRPDLSPIKQEIDITTIGHASPDSSGPISIDLTSPVAKPKVKHEPDESMNADPGNTSTSMDHSGDREVKEEPVDLTASPQNSHKSTPPHTPNIKHEPMDQSYQSNSPHREPVKNSPYRVPVSDSPYRKPVNSPLNNGEPIDLTSTPQHPRKKHNFVDTESEIRSPLKELKVFSNIFGKTDTPNQGHERSVNGDLESRSQITSEAFVVDSPDPSTLNRSSSTRHSSNNADVTGDSSMIEDSVIVNESVIMSDEEQGEVNKSGRHGNISVQEVRSILEKSLCSNVEDLSRSHMSTAQDSPVVAKNKRRSVCVRRVIESSEEEDEDNDSNNDDNDNDAAADDDGADSDNEAVDKINENSFDEENVNNRLNEGNDNGADEDDNEADKMNEDSFVEENESNRLNHRDDNSADEENALVDSESMNEDDDKDGINNSNVVDVSEAGSDNENDKNNKSEIPNAALQDDYEADMGDTNVDPEGDMDHSHNDNETNAVNVDEIQEGDVDRMDEQSEEEELVEEEEELQDFESLPEEEQIRYNELVEAGRLYCSNRQYEEAQTCVLQALEILADEELQATAVSIQKKIIKYQRKKAMEQQQ